jgi:hypothetical protein
MAYPFRNFLRLVICRKLEADGVIHITENRARSAREKLHGGG